MVKEQKVDNKENVFNDTMWECRLKGSNFSKKEKKCPSTKISCSCNGKIEIIKNNKEQFSETEENFTETIENVRDNDGFNYYLMILLIFVIGYYSIKHLIIQ